MCVCLYERVCEWMKMYYIIIWLIHFSAKNIAYIFTEPGAHITRTETTKKNIFTKIMNEWRTLIGAIPMVTMAQSCLTAHGKLSYIHKEWKAGITSIQFHRKNRHTNTRTHVVRAHQHDTINNDNDNCSFKARHDTSPTLRSVCRNNTMTHQHKERKNTYLCVCVREREID